MKIFKKRTWKPNRKSSTKPTSSYARRAVCSSTWTKRSTSTVTTWRYWCLMRPTGCSTWASPRPWTPSWRICQLRVKPSSSQPPRQSRSKTWHVSVWKHQPMCRFTSIRQSARPKILCKTMWFARLRTRLAFYGLLSGIISTRKSSFFFKVANK